MKIFSIDEHIIALAAYLPDGRTFEAKGISGSNVRQLLEGMSAELKRSQEYINTLNQEFIPDQTVLFLDEWERALGIPDSCFSGSGSSDERRRDILTKLASLGVQTIEDFENVAAIFGVSATVQAGIDSSVVFNSLRDARYTIVVSVSSIEGFPYTFPLLFGSSTVALLECIFNKLKPDNCQVLFEGI